MSTESVLFRDISGAPVGRSLRGGDFLTDLNLDQIVTGIIADKPDYDLAPFFHAPLLDVDGIAFRHEVMKDLEHADLFNDLKAFADIMRSVRSNLAEIEER